VSQLFILIHYFNKIRQHLSRHLQFLNLTANAYTIKVRDTSTHCKAIDSYHPIILLAAPVILPIVVHPLSIAHKNL
jgi:hypothetical protein